MSDYQYFQNEKVPAAAYPQPWPSHEKYNTKKISDSLEAFNKKPKTVAYLVIKNDSLFFEKYYEGYGPDSKSNSFSMAKSIVSALLGKAISEGHIKSLDQPVKDFLPQLKGPYAEVVIMGDLSSMSSGLNWDEDYDAPLSLIADAYYTSDLKSLVLDQPINTIPGKAFIYKSGATQLLGMAMENALDQKLSRYLNKSFWQELGAEKEALWQVDSKKRGTEKFFCCFASNARDFTRFGKLYKDHGRWNNSQLLDSTFIAKSIRPRFESSPQYGYGWWLRTHNNQKVFYMDGHLGQYVIMMPEKNLIVVRLGHTKKNKKAPVDDIGVYLNAAIKLTKDVKTD